MTRLLVAAAPLLLLAGPTLAQTSPGANPHAGHVMPSPPRSSAPDPHAGHAMPGRPASGQTDPHAGHDMSGMIMGPPDVPARAETPETPPPPAAFAGPAHAADLIFGAEAMEASRKVLIAENGDVRTTAVILDRVEAGFGDDGDTWLWDAQGWSGGDIHRLWWKSEGEGDIDGKLEDAEVQLLYSRAITPFWDVQAGVRQDVRPHGPDTTYAVLGIQGLAPHWWEIDAAAFLSTEGDLTVRAEAEYDQRLTQRLILQPRFEVEASAGDSPEQQIGRGLSSVQAGLRLRYEIRKELAPYIGVEWSRSLGGTADRVRASGGTPDDTRFVVGLKAWF